MDVNVYATSNYDRLRDDKALGFCQSDNNNKKYENEKSKKTMFVAMGGIPSPKI